MSTPMTDTNSVGVPSGLLPQHLLDPVLIKPVMEESVAARVSTSITTTSAEVVVPLITDDPSASWVNEGAEIATSAAQSADLAIRPVKIAGISVISTELAADSSADVSGIIGRGLARDIARQIDAAYFGTVGAPAPSGLTALDGATSIDAGSAFSSLDPFVDAMKESEVLGMPVTTWVAHPDDVATISKIKRAADSQERLITSVRDDAGSIARAIDGVPLLQSPYVAAGTVWGIPSAAALFVRRDEARIETSDQQFFSSDRLAIRAIMRVGWGFINPPAIMKITTG